MSQWFRVLPPELFHPFAGNCKLEQETVDAERIVRLLSEFDPVGRGEP